MADFKIPVSTNDPQLSRSFRGHRATVNTVSLNPNMKNVASGSEDSSI